MFRDQRLDRGRRQIVGPHLGERPAETADRGPDGNANIDITHLNHSLNAALAHSLALDRWIDGKL